MVGLKSMTLRSKSPAPPITLTDVSASLYIINIQYSEKKDIHVCSILMWGIYDCNPYSPSIAFDVKPPKPALALHLGTWEL